MKVIKLLNSLRFGFLLTSVLTGMIIAGFILVNWIGSLLETHKYLAVLVVMFFITAFILSLFYWLLSNDEE